MDRVFFVTLLLGIIVSCALVYSVQKKRKKGQIKEMFTYNANSILSYDNSDNTSNNVYLLIKSLLYFYYLAPYFMSDDSANGYYTDQACKTAINAGCDQLVIFKFLPTFLDSYCTFKNTTNKPTTAGTKNNTPKTELTVLEETTFLTGFDQTCNTFLIENVSSFDDTTYDSDQSCKNMTSSVGVGKDAAKMRILSYNYLFAKRCIQFYLHHVETVTTDRAYIITTHGNMNLFNLLRPCFISFPGVGLFSIQSVGYTQKGDIKNSMISYSNKLPSSSPQVLQNTYYIKAVTESEIDANQSQSSYQAPPLGASTNFPTIYYPSSLQEPAIIKTGMLYNSYSVVFDNKMLNTSWKDFSPSITMSDVTTNNLCKSITFNWNKENATVNPGNLAFYVSIDATVTSGDPSAYLIHADFPKATAINSSTIFHIVVTYTLDLLIITSFMKDLMQGNKTQITMKQYKVRSNTQARQPVFLQYKKDVMTTNTNFVETSSGGSSGSTPRKLNFRTYESLVNFDEIPNLANLAKQLGYTL